MNAKITERDALICIIQQQINSDNNMITLIQDTIRKREQLLLKLVDYGGEEKKAGSKCDDCGQMVDLDVAYPSHLCPGPDSKPEWEHRAGCDDEHRSRYGCSCERDALGDDEYFKWHTAIIGETKA